jgi:hypothetical protein
MSVIPIQDALDHQRIDSEDGIADAQRKLDAAEDAAMQFLNRNFYATDAALAQAQALILQRHDAAVATRDAAFDVAHSVADADYKQLLMNAAESVFCQTKAQIGQTILGIVINPSIHAAVMLTFGHLFENREDVGASMVELPKGAHHLLWPYRVDLGV